MPPRRRALQVQGAVLLSVLTLVFVPGTAPAQEVLPAFSNYVVDAAGVVPDDVERQVNATLGDYQSRSTNQVAVAVVRTTAGRPIEEYSLALATSWGVGEQGKDNGVLVVIAHNDRRVRIEVGRGLEAVLTDQVAAGIVNDGLVPRLRQGNVGAAVIFATESIRRVLGDAQAPPASSAPVPAAVPAQPVQTDRRLQPTGPQPAFDPVGPGVPGGGDGFPSWVVVAFPVLALFGIVSSFGSSRRSGFRSHGPMFWGHGAGWGPGGHQHSSSSSWGSSHGSAGHSGGGSGGSFGGGGGGSFGGGGASGTW